MKKTAVLFVLTILSISGFSQGEVAHHGVIDLRNWDFHDEGHIPLDGEWEFYMMELISPTEIASSKTAKDYVDFPFVWNESSKSLQPGYGYATFRLRVLVKSPQKLAFDLPHFYSNYTMWINGEEVSRNGIVGKSVATSTAQWLPRIVQYQVRKDTLDIVIQSSNFFHAMGGVRESILIGATEKLVSKHDIAVSSTVMLVGVLAALCIGFICLYLFFRQERVALYFAALCFTWALRECFSNLYVVTAAYPTFPWEIAVKIEYITLYLTMVWATLFLRSIFTEDASTLFTYFFVSCNVIFVVLTIFGGASFYTQFLPVYLSFAGVLLIYVLYVLLQAIIRERQGVWFLVGCIMVGVIVFGYDIIAYEGFMEFNSIITNSGYIGMFLLLALSLVFQFGIVKGKAGASDVLTYDDLYGTKSK